MWSSGTCDPYFTKCEDQQINVNSPNEELPNINRFKIIVNLKYEAEKYICTKNNNLDKFKKKWTI